MTLHKQKLKRNYNKLPNWQKRILRDTNQHIHIFSVRDYENVDAIKIEKMWQILEICIPTRESGNERKRVNMKKYVTGFLFSEDSMHVVLIKKLNPKWQRGLFNGVGGKIEENESSCNAMVREFEEETGVVIVSEKWTCYTKIYRPNYYELDVYYAYSNLAYKVKTIEKEEVCLVATNTLPSNIVPNLRWLIPLALDNQTDFSNPIVINEISEERIQA